MIEANFALWHCIRCNITGRVENGELG